MIDTGFRDEFIDKLMKQLKKTGDTKMETTEVEELKKEILALNKRIDDLNISEVRGRIAATNERIEKLEQELEEHSNKQISRAHKTMRL